MAICVYERLREVKKKAAAEREKKRGDTGRCGCNFISHSNLFIILDKPKNIDHMGSMNSQISAVRCAKIVNCTMLMA